MQQILKSGVVKSKDPGVLNCTLLMCGSCITGKAKPIGIKSVSKIPNHKHHNILKKEDLLPNQRINTDQYECRIKGRLPYTKDKEDPKKIYCGGNLLVDHASRYIKIFN